MTWTQRITKWTRWIEGRTIRGDVFTMHLQRDAWLEVSKIIKGPRPAAGLLLVGVHGRHLHHYPGRRGPAAGSYPPGRGQLSQLLTELSGNSALVTRDFWIGLWGRDSDQPLEPIDRQFAESHWAEHYGGGESLDPAIPARDLAALQDAAASVKAFVNKHIAHAEENPGSDAVGFSVREVHHAIEVIGKLFTRYSTLFTAAGYVTLVPTIHTTGRPSFGRLGSGRRIGLRSVRLGEMRPPSVEP